MSPGNRWQPAMKDLEVAYFEKWASNLKRDTVLFRLGQADTLRLDTMVFVMRYDSVTGLGNNRKTWWSLIWKSRVTTWNKIKKVWFPYSTSYLDLYASWPYTLTYRWVPEIVLRYQFQLATDSLFTPASLVFNDSTIVDSVIINNLVSTTVYYERARMRYAWGWSIWSPAIRLANITNLRLSMVNGAPSVTQYQFQVAKDSIFSSQNLVVNDSTVTDTFYVLQNLELSTIYYVRVRGKNANGWGGWGSGARFTTSPSAKIVFNDLDFLILEPLGITAALNEANRQVKMRITRHARPIFVYN
jgi:hypothetical protein